MRVQNDLPDLDSHNQQRAQAMQDWLKNVIQQQGGWASFDQFMSDVLYTPGWGYYCSDTWPFGETGDYVTAPQISRLFSQTVAYQCQAILKSGDIEDGAILEVGPGGAEMAADIMRTLAEQDCLPYEYGLLEISPVLRDQQKAYLQQTVPELMRYFVWYEDWPQKCQGVVLANEVLDALPVKLWQYYNQNYIEYGVTVTDDQLTWSSRLADDSLQQTIQHIQDSPGVQAWPDQFTSEVHPHIGPWLKQLSERLEKGVVLLFDYGYPRAEYYRAERNTGTLKCFFRHTVHENPLINLGCQDITAHIDFTTVVEQAYQAGLTLEGFCSQADFLINNGINELMPTDFSMAEQPKLGLANQLKQLLMPEEMGEIIKVMGLSKGFQDCLQGFERHDLSRLL